MLFLHRMVLFHATATTRTIICKAILLVSWPSTHRSFLGPCLQARVLLALFSSQCLDVACSEPRSNPIQQQQCHLINALVDTQRRHHAALLPLLFTRKATSLWITSQATYHGLPPRTPRACEDPAVGSVRGKSTGPRRWRGASGSGLPTPLPRADHGPRRPAPDNGYSREQASRQRGMHIL